MNYRKSDGAFGMLPKKTTALPWSAGGAVALPWKGELDTADRRLRELEEHFLEEEGEGAGEEASAEESPSYPWRKPV